MKLLRVLLVGSAILGAGADASNVRLVKRQNVSQSAATTSAGGDSTSSAPASTSSPSPSSTPNNGGSGSTTQGGGSSSGGDGGQDTTVFETVTKTEDSSAGVVTVTTTDFTTITTTSTLTSTVFSTTTITSHGGQTATSTQYETTTVINKRSIEEPTAAPGAVAALATAIPRPTGVKHAVPGSFFEIHDLLPRAMDLEKRATVTVIDTVTVGKGGGASTLVTTVLNTKTKVMTDVTTATNVITEIDQVDAKTTVTVTSTLTVTSTAVSTGVSSTGTSTSNPDISGGSGSSSSGGLSTGAKAGIGAGVGVAGLILIAGLVWFFMRRGRSPKPDYSDDIGHSEVPIGRDASSGGGTLPSMSAVGGAAGAAGAAGFRSPNRGYTKSSNTTAEGYRGTAMGDGRAGYAKPAPYGSAYTQSTQGRTSTLQSAGDSIEMDSVGAGGHGHYVPQHSAPQAELGNDVGHANQWHDASATEMDTQPAHRKPSGPIYEMPATNF